MLPAEVDLDIRALQLLVDVRQIVLHMLVGHLDVVMLFDSTHHSLVPHSHAIFSTCLSLKLAYNWCENSVGVPVHKWGQVQIHIKCEW